MLSAKSINAKVCNKTLRQPGSYHNYYTIVTMPNCNTSSNCARNLYRETISETLRRKKRGLVDINVIQQPSGFIGNSIFERLRESSIYLEKPLHKFHERIRVLFNVSAHYKYMNLMIDERVNVTYCVPITSDRGRFDTLNKNHL